MNIFKRTIHFIIRTEIGETSFFQTRAATFYCQLTHNIFSLYLKFFLWKKRCKRLMPNIIGFKNFLNYEIMLIKDAFRGKIVIDRLTCIQ